MVYLYAGLRAGIEPAELLEAAVRDGAPFVRFDDYKAWVADSLVALRETR